MPPPLLEIYPALRRIATSFVLSRLLILVVWVVMFSLHVPSDTTPANQATIELNVDTLSEGLRTLATRNDAGWYFDIADHGYEARPFDASRPANWAFFPLNAYVLRGIDIVDGHDPLGAIVVANLFFVLSLWLLWRTSIESGFSPDVADGAVFFVALYPTSYFFSLPWSESLFYALSLGTYLAALRRQWLLVALLGAATCATRLTGIFLVLAIGLTLWPQRTILPKRAWIAITLAPLGLLTFMIQLYVATGNALAFLEIQKQWGRSFVLPYRAIGVVFVKPWEWATDWNLRPLNVAVLTCGIFASVWFWRNRYRDFSVFLGLGVLAPAFTGSMTSMCRYGMSLFPLAIAGGVFIQSRSRERWLAALFAALLVLLSVAFQQGIGFAGA